MLERSREQIGGISFDLTKFTVGQNIISTSEGGGFEVRRMAENIIRVTYFNRDSGRLISEEIDLLNEVSEGRVFNYGSNSLAFDGCNLVWLKGGRILNFVDKQTRETKQVVTGVRGQLMELDENLEIVHILNVTKKNQLLNETEVKLYTGILLFQLVLTMGKMYEQLDLVLVPVFCVLFLHSIVKILEGWRNLLPANYDLNFLYEYIERNGLENLKSIDFRNLDAGAVADVIKNNHHIGGIVNSVRLKLEGDLSFVFAGVTGIGISVARLITDQDWATLDYFSILLYLSPVLRIFTGGSDYRKTADMVIDSLRLANANNDLGPVVDEKVNLENVVDSSLDFDIDLDPDFVDQADVARGYTLPVSLHDEEQVFESTEAVVGVNVDKR